MKLIDHSNDGRRTWPLITWRTFEGATYGERFVIEQYNPYRKEMEKLEFWEGEHCNLYFPSAHVYRWHPVTAIIQFLRLPCFSHITLAQAGAALAVPHLDPERYHIEAPRLSDDAAFQEWLRAHGLYCRSCQKVLHPEWDDPAHNRYWWERHDFCPACALTLERKRVDAQTRSMLREREFKKAVRLKRQRDEERREAADMEYRKRKEERRREKERERLEMLAAYELVKELGLIDVVRQKGDDHEAGKAA